LKAVKSQLMAVKRGRNLLSQSQTAATPKVTPSQTPKRRHSQRRRTVTVTTNNMLATIQPMMFSPFHSASSSMADDLELNLKPMDLRESALSPLTKGKSVDILSSKQIEPRSPTISYRKFSSFDDENSSCFDEENHHHHDRLSLGFNQNQNQNRIQSQPPISMKHSLIHRKSNIVDPVQPFFRRKSHSNSNVNNTNIQKRGRNGRTLKDRTRSFHHSPSSLKSNHNESRHSLPPQSTQLHHHAVSAQATSSIRRLQTPTRKRSVVKRRSFHSVTSRPTV